MSYRLPQKYQKSSVTGAALFADVAAQRIQDHKLPYRRCLLVQKELLAVEQLLAQERAKRELG